MQSVRALRGVNPKFRPQEFTRFASLESLEQGCKAIIDRVCGLQK